MLKSNVTVSGSATIQVNGTNTGEIKGAISGRGTLTKDGEGSLAVSSSLEMHWVNTLKGTILIEGEGENTINTLDAGVNGTAVGKLVVGEQAVLKVTNIIFMKKGSLEVENGGSLVFEPKYMTVTGESDSANAVLKRKDNAKGGQITGLGDGNLVISNARVIYGADAKDDVTVSAILENSSIENASEHTLTVGSSDSKLTGIHATGGNVTVSGIDPVELQELQIKTNKTVEAAAITVSELAELQAGATLNADLVLASGATLELGGTMTLEGVLNLQTGLTLSGTVLDIVKGLTEGDSYTLFTGVEGLNLQQTITLFNMRSLAAQTEDAVTYEPFMGDTQVAAADYFSNLNGNSGLVLDYNSSTGAVSITYAAAVPEPATATLSLLALAGLCARRRRKS